MILKGFRFGMILQIAVGPVCLFIFQTAVTSGFFTALIGVLGIVIIDTLYILSAIFGIGIIMCKHEKMKEIIKYFGALVLIVFGISTILEVFGFSLIPNLNFLSKQSMESVFLKTLVLTLSNPLTILFWVGVFSTKVSEENMNKKDMYYFGLGAVISTMTFLTTISVMGSFINNFLESTIINTLNFIVGLVLIAFGIKTAVYNQMKNSKYKIKMNRYPENIILEKWEKADKTQKTVLIDSSELDLSIEIDGYENTSNDVVVSFLLNIREVDNIVQKFCKNSFQQGKFDIRNYMVSLEWVTFDTDKVVMGYWGEFVNIELRAIFLMKNGIWEKRDIYYQ